MPEIREGLKEWRSWNFEELERKPRKAEYPDRGLPRGSKVGNPR
jgi:hypothetical protein